MVIHGIRIAETGVRFSPGPHGPTKNIGTLRRREFDSPWVHKFMRGVADLPIGRQGREFPPEEDWPQAGDSPQVHNIDIGI